MRDNTLYLFWVVVTALWVFAAVYAWFIAVIMRKSLPGEMAWMFFSLGFITGSNALIRAGNEWMIVEHLVILSRAMFLAAAISACVSVVMLGRTYNGAFNVRLPWRKQMKLLGDAFKEVNEEGHESKA